jgi:TonB family protein
MTQAWKQWEGQVVNGGFHLRQYLGGREQSAVFLTEDRERGLEKAAIKLVPADAEKAELQISRWKAAAKLSHPQLVRLFQTGSCQLGGRDLVYVEMEYAEVNLAQILQRGPLPSEETQETLKLILNALAYLHGKGFIHGHLKPANILGVGNQLKLSSDSVCRIGELGGGPGTLGVYDPPEAADGIYSPAGDVWSLGMTLVEVLPEHPPLWVRTEQGDPVLPLTLPAPFFDIARNCLRYDPERRWPLAVIAARLEPAARALPLPAPKPKISARPQKVSTKRRAIGPAVLVALALAVLLAGLRLLNRHSAEPGPDQNPVTRSVEPPAQKSSRELQNSSSPQLLQPSLQSKVAAQAPADRAAQGEVRQKVLPNVPQSALNTIRGTIRVTVKVAVDPAGNVVEATLDSAGPSKYFAGLALEAARQWKFRPAEVAGGRDRNERTLEFSFERTGTEASTVQAAP